MVNTTRTSKKEKELNQLIKEMEKAPSRFEHEYMVEVYDKKSKIVGRRIKLMIKNRAKGPGRNFK